MTSGAASLATKVPERLRLAKLRALLPRGGDLVAAGLCAATFTAWIAVAAAPPSLRVVAFFGGYSLALAFAGRLAVRVLPEAVRESGGLPLRLLAGYLVVNSAFMLLFLALPARLPWIAAAVIVGVVAAGIASRGRDEPRPDASALPGLACVVLCLLAATLWCRDSLTPWQAAPDGWVFEPWRDSFLHSRRIAMFAFAEGRATLHSVVMGDQPPPPYHYAAYFSPAALVGSTSIPSLGALTSFQVPAGIFLSGLAAFVLAASLWGPWPGLAASAALLLLPDAAQHGAANHFFSYHWLQQVGPAGAVGVAVAALAWSCILAGCRGGRLPAILVGWAIAALCLAYKAHIFVANAFLWWVFPPLFLRGLPARWRATWLLASVTSFAVAVALSQRLDRVPTIRLDGSALTSYTRIVLQHFDPGPVSRLFQLSTVDGASPVQRVAVAAVMLLVVTFGLLAPACVALLAAVWRRSEPALAAFPLLVVASYLAMSLGLAMNHSGTGGPEELLHRPFVWAWFAVCVWTSAAAYHLAFGSHAPRSRRMRAALGVATVLCLAFPWALGHRIQHGPPFGAGFTRMRLPSGLVSAASFLRRTAGRHELVQDSANDPGAVVSGLSERQAFLIQVRRPPAGFASRLEQVESLRRLSSVEALRAAGRRTGIQWYVLRPGERVAWPKQVVDRPAFAADGYRVYRLPGA